jgi:hypothetical protein
VLWLSELEPLVQVGRTQVEEPSVGADQGDAVGADA